MAKANQGAIDAIVDRLRGGQIENARAELVRLCGAHADDVDLIALAGWEFICEQEDVGRTLEYASRLGQIARESKASDALFFLQLSLRPSAVGGDPGQLVELMPKGAEPAPQGPHQAALMVAAHLAAYPLALSALACHGSNSGVGILTTSVAQACVRVRVRDAPEALRSMDAALANPRQEFDIYKRSFAEAWTPNPSEAHLFARHIAALLAARGLALRDLGRFREAGVVWADQHLAEAPFAWLMPPLQAEARRLADRPVPASNWRPDTTKPSWRPKPARATMPGGEVRQAPAQAASSGCAIVLALVLPAALAASWMLFG